ncbi:thiol-disulfide isomerase/thioredoxin [Saccharothrix tamanrassetensis]|uniref:Thiol-disulfide isomerase/thioredoxin n=1 Tax=Saccharothrix tamanrassetensis TaxID=1051531 RepID=A0A841CF24_9PSEU|nr:thioredoxin family protein [Saccharothrix tamanrassetensis]MBB5954615.1 thiol-disulfide isomerase/thioredoxin [Saccharothrix tamanrassetensis]
MTGVWALLGAVAVVAVIGVVLRVQNGRIRTGRVGTDLPEPVRALLDPATPVTLVQISTTFCAPCRHTRALLEDLAGRTDGLRHVELDVTDRPEVAAGLGVLRTPTTLALDASGTELLRVGGVPERDALLAALRPHLPGPIG